MSKIFQIGFNKSGTSSIHQFMLKNDIPSIHWAGGNLSKRMLQNHGNGEPLLSGYDDYVSYTDMEHNKEDGGYFYSGEAFFRELDNQYPGSCFILNYRSFDNWVKSRVNHNAYLLHCLREFGDKDKVLKAWENEYYSHIESVKDYFSERSCLLDLNIDEMSSSDLGEFLKRHGVSIKEVDFPHFHKTNKISKNQHIDAIRDAAFFVEKTDVELALKLMECAKSLRPEGKIINNRIKWYKEVLHK